MVVGLNDALGSRWDPDAIREDLLACARDLTAQGALLITVRFHDHARVLGLPEFLARPVRERIRTLNAIHDEIHERYGLLQLDLAELPWIYDRDVWAVDRLHPSESGHRRLAREVGALLQAEGLEFTLPSAAAESPQASRTEVARTVFLEMVPWLGRRARELAPGAARRAVRRGRVRLGVA